MQQQPKQDCRKGKSIRYPAANYVIYRPNESAQKGASRVCKLDIQFSHEMLSGPQFRFDMQSCKVHIGLDPEGWPVESDGPGESGTNADEGSPDRGCQDLHRGRGAQPD